MKMNFKSILMQLFQIVCKLYLFLYSKIWKNNVHKEKCTMSDCGMQTRRENNVTQAPSPVSSRMIGRFLWYLWFDSLKVWILEAREAPCFIKSLLPLFVKSLGVLSTELPPW